MHGLRLSTAGHKGSIPRSISSHPPALHALWQTVDSSPSRHLDAPSGVCELCVESMLAVRSVSISPLLEKTCTSARLRHWLPATSIRKYCAKTCSLHSNTKGRDGEEKKKEKKKRDETRITCVCCWQCVYVRVCVTKMVCLCVCVCVCMCTCICMCVHVCVCSG